MSIHFNKQRHIDRVTSTSLRKGGSVGVNATPSAPSSEVNPAKTFCSKCSMNGVIVRLIKTDDGYICGPCQEANKEDPDSVCDGCSQSYPMSELENVDGQELCPICAEEEAEKDLGNED